jgi:prepilin-type N-terminal cleavage/methylation domain-containing protein/prepilin-type processing-associated H-X9-DG protein
MGKRRLEPTRRRVVPFAIAGGEEEDFAHAPRRVGKNPASGNRNPKSSRDGAAQVSGLHTFPRPLPCRSPLPVMKKSAFTLIELLVVISIIAILASIAVPVFSKAIENGKSTNCLANVRQLAMGTVAYLNDNDDQMFPQSGSWSTTLHEKYVTAWKSYRSPFDKRPDREMENAPVSYGVNKNLFDELSSKFGSASELILMSAAPDPGGAELKFSGTGNSNTSASPASGPKDGVQNNRSKINVAYADGHAATITALEHSISSGEAGLKRWFPASQSKK